MKSYGKTLAVTLLIAACIMWSASFVAADTLAVSNEPVITVTASSSSARPGDTVTFEVKLSGSFSKSLALSLRVLFPTEVFESLTVVGGELTIPGNSADDDSFMDDVYASDELGYVNYMAWWTYPYTGTLDVTLFTVTATVRETALDGDAGVAVCTDIEKTMHTDSDYDTLPFSVVDPELTIVDGFNLSSTMTKEERAENTIILQLDNYAAIVDGSLSSIYPGENNITPYLKVLSGTSGRTMVPIRFIAENLSAEVSWIAESSTVVINLNGVTVKMDIGSTEYTVNGETKTMDSAAEILPCNDGSGNGRTMVPLRFVAEALGKAVVWDADNRLIFITDADVPWHFGNDAENELTSEALVMIAPFLKK